MASLEVYLNNGVDSQPKSRPKSREDVSIIYDWTFHSNSCNEFDASFLNKPSSKKLN